MIAKLNALLICCSIAFIGSTINALAAITQNNLDFIDVIALTSTLTNVAVSAGYKHYIQHHNN